MHVDFARPPFWPVVVLWGAVAVTLAAAGWVGARDLKAWRTLAGKHERTAALHSQFEAMQATAAAQAASAAELPPFAIDARRWLALAGVDGPGALRAVESAQVAGAKVIAIDVNAEAQRVELNIEVGSAEVAGTYLQALNAGVDEPAWSLVRLQAQGAGETALIRGQIR